MEINAAPFPQAAVTPKTGDEPFHSHDDTLSFHVRDFWSWSSSDLVSNTMRGILAEYLVAVDLGIADRLRTEWASYDLLSRSGTTVEVKSAAYHQSWAQSKPSAIQFGIAATAGWDATTGLRQAGLRRQADVYVFALLHHQDRSSVDPLDVSQWTFYVLATRILNELMPSQKQLSLAKLLALQPRLVPWGSITEAVEDAAK